MTRIADTTTTNKLTDWIYDVHVYPKNSTAYAAPVLWIIFFIFSAVM